MEAMEHLSLFLRSDNSAKIVNKMTDVNNNSNAYAYIGHSVTILAFCCLEALCNFSQNVNIPIISVFMHILILGTRVFSWF